MPSFNCDGCGDVIKKPKLDLHSSRCQASMTCLDCSTTFPNPASWKGHTSCITEAEKFEKSVYKPPKDKQKKALDASLTTTPAIPGSSTSAPQSQVCLPRSSASVLQSSTKPAKKPKKSKGEKRSQPEELPSQTCPSSISVDNTPKPPELSLKDGELKKKEKKKRKPKREPEVAGGESKALEPVTHVKATEKTEERPKKKKKSNKQPQLPANQGGTPGPVSSGMPMGENTKPEDHTPFVITMSQVSSAAKGLIMAARGASISMRELIDSVTSFVQGQQTRPGDVVLREDISRMLCDGAVKFFHDKQADTAETIALYWA